MIARTANSARDLLNIVADSNPDPGARGPVVVEVTLSDDHLVRASYYSGPKFQTPDAETKFHQFNDVAPLMPHVDRLLKTGQSFVTLTGESDSYCCLEWTIAAK